MSLSPSSSIIIDLLLLADAAVAGDKKEVGRLARRIQGVAERSGSRVIATRARTVELLAGEDPTPGELAAAVDRLLSEAEREIHDIGIWTDQCNATSDRRSA
ncbi:hypothetical protein BJI69_19380 [Luteibacter rhizovicinus DSM 16549]|uniref:Uncharacterized protein n=1 Tax=Luteibacter rhizovicinus DSM 16549 TaxID=1440763 RepID=A0A0G9HC49_9GAMM|nr:hypothetical protein [Luteibacter rhizovicinus]APG05854.1 hypothetical protein BJI69_19380 [Luteibacter rhizovicinus DSM 16549]KLD67198.1 hypothetical protein Y883_09625 [Luteibacter rhizovicinus DSM 16549]KLD76465.1 hypothetical protein Y886_21230 [Xanthomonas hyacinthi DSM 19077]